jgi:hypothetical protein
MESETSKSVEGTAQLEHKVPSKSGPESTSTKLRDDVKARLVQQNPEVYESVVVKMVTTEKERRVVYLQKAFDELANLEKEFKKIVPDLAVLAVDGSTTEFYSKELLKKRQDVKDKIDKLETAVNKAIQEKDWSALSQLIDNLPKDKTTPASS